MAAAAAAVLAEGRISSESAALGLVLVAAGERDWPWGAVADRLGIAALYPVIAVPEEQGPTERLAPLPPLNEERPRSRTVEAPPPASEAVYRLGATAIDAVGIFRADSLPGEEQTRARYNRFLGSIATAGAGEQPTARRSSLDIMRAAADGDPASREALFHDTWTHVHEVLGGVGEGMEVRLKVDEQGEVVWGGQTTEDRQYHAITTYTGQSPAINQAVHAEGRSAFRMQDRNRDGQLRGRRLFESAPLPEASRDELAEHGYFLNSIGFCFRSNRFTEDELELRTVFVAGVDQRFVAPQAGETEAQEAARQERALASRFDLRVLRKMYSLFGVKGAANMTPTQLLDIQTVAPDTYDELDMVMLYDTLAADEIVDGQQTFFGSVELWQQLGSPARLTREHYELHMQGCKERQAKYESLCQEITDEIIRRQHEAWTPHQAFELKRRVVLDMTVERAVRDDTIDAARFGRVAAPIIDAARAEYARGNDGGGDRLIEEAKEKAVDPSCPTGARNKINLESGNEHGQEDDCREVKNGDRVNCPYCKQSVKAVVPEKGGRIYCGNGRCKEAFKSEPAAPAERPSAPKSFGFMALGGQKKAPISPAKPRVSAVAAPRLFDKP